MKFAMQGAQDSGEFFTPPRWCRPSSTSSSRHGVIFDPLRLGGMFVQSSHFIEHEGQETMKRATFYGRRRQPRPSGSPR